MSTLAVEINDVGVLARARGDAGLRDPSPGVALLEGAAIVTGHAAERRARLNPSLISDRFWMDLDTAPAGGAFPGYAHADLAHEHLSSVWGSIGARAARVLLAVPGSFTRRQCGILLGLARACGMPVEGLVDAAIAAAAVAPAPRGGAASGRILHFDLHRRRGLLTAMGRHGTLVRESVAATDEVGTASLLDAWARKIADISIRTTRFDPLHAAVTEQHLYLDMPGLIARLVTGDRDGIVLRDAAGGRHEVEVTRGAITDAARAGYEACQRLVAAAAPRPGEVLLLSHRAAGLPGLADRLAGAFGVIPVPLPPEATAQGALVHEERIRAGSGALPLVLTLPAPASPRSPAAAGGA